MSKKHTLEKFGTDIERLRNMKDKDIDYSDIPKTTPKMWENGILLKNFKPIPRKNQENFPIDKDIIEFFKAQSFNYPAKINQLLRDYMEAHENK
ncbi:BrnA antitoxin family protein [soil metagenome]